MLNHIKLKIRRPLVVELVKKVITTLASRDRSWPIKEEREFKEKCVVVKVLPYDASINMIMSIQIYKVPWNHTGFLENINHVKKKW